ncbi:MAG: hypothetical protein H5T69_03465 [Chloroflexi bacterium]|nr:hypothetical protein [Chloroflexota bacterium]
MSSTWVVLDFSGTLSLQATLFGQEQNLIRELQISGLWRLGVRDIDFFWSEIVAPTWQEGSTTRKGYKRVLAERLQELGLGANEDERLAAAERFVDRYLAYSTIDPAWGATLRRLQRHPAVRVIVATDHYAEATTHILGQLAALGVEAAPAGTAELGRAVLVANSADVGHHKASRLFWETLRALQNMEPAALLLIDDFGANENPLDRYAEPARVKARQSQTVELLGSVFTARIAVLAFLLGTRPESRLPADQEELERHYRALIRDAEQFLFDHLKGV